MQFFLVEYNPAKLEEPIKHDVWARNKARDEVQKLKLEKNDSIEAVLYRHTWETKQQGGGTQAHTRHNLGKILRVERKEDAKRSTNNKEPGGGNNREALYQLFPCDNLPGNDARSALQKGCEKRLEAKASGRGARL